MRSLFLIYQVITLFLGAGTVSKLHKCGPFFFKVNTTFFARNFNSNFLPSFPPSP